jgi:predicted AlkP superfamily pyrophosphatase or phosphodiesterase
MQIRVALVVIVANLFAANASASPVLMISIDGLRPADVLEADKRGLKIPNLRRFIAEGSYADAVIGVLPTVTYPSHTTLITGASPAKHGIVSNTTFDPLNINAGGWYWFASDIKVPTLWDAARGSGMSVANVHWPVSVGASNITWNLPQIWRTGHPDDEKLVHAVSTAGLLESLEKTLGPYAPGIDESIEGDETRGRFAAQLNIDKKPGFATVYLTALDHMQHLTGPGSPESHAVLERIDTIVGKLMAAGQRAQPNLVIAIVSDHGFAPTTTEVNLFRFFIDAGLVTLGDDGKIKSWEATPWNSGGSIAIVLARPGDAVLVEKVRALLNQLQSNTQSHIAEIIDKRSIATLGGNPEATFYINLAAGALAAGFGGKDAPLSKPAKYRGMHGYFPGSSEMRSTFMMMGSGITQHRSYGEIDMRVIAPTLAAVLGIGLPTAEKPPLTQ